MWTWKRCGTVLRRSSLVEKKHCLSTKTRCEWRWNCGQVCACVRAYVAGRKWVVSCWIPPVLNNTWGREKRKRRTSVRVECTSDVVRLTPSPLPLLSSSASCQWPLRPRPSPSASCSSSGRTAAWTSSSSWMVTWTASPPECRPTAW